jgi:hypothetical protein
VLSFRLLTKTFILALNENKLMLKLKATLFIFFQMILEIKYFYYFKHQIISASIKQAIALSKIIYYNKLA